MTQQTMFENGEDTPLFSQTPMRVREKRFAPRSEGRQLHLGGCPICEGTGLVILRRGEEAQYCTCEAGVKARQSDVA